MTVTQFGEEALEIVELTMSDIRGSNSCATDRNALSISTLYIKPAAGKLRRDEIFSHFSAFGAIRSVRIRNKPTHSFGFVKFTQAESAKRALEIEFHVIAGRRVKIAFAHDRHQDGATNHRPSLLDLNDDCIHEILSTECLSTLDLCSVAETSRRFKEIAVGTFKRKYAKCDLDSYAIREVKSAQRLLRNFGAVISDLEISGWLFKKHETSVLESVARHCRNTLESLCLRKCIITDNFPAELKPIFNKLQKLQIESCHFEGASKELFADCGSLVELGLYDGCNDGFIVDNTFPKLQKFKYSFGVAKGNTLASFISRHKNLTSIAFPEYFEMSSLLPMIADNCKQLEELEFSIHEDQTYDLSNFVQLRKLNISVSEGITEAVRGWNNLQFLENLTLRLVNIDPEFIKTLSQLKRLQVLTLKWCHGLEDWNRIGDLNQLKELEIDFFESVALDFVALIKRLSNLKALSVKTDDFKYKIDLETYLRIVNVVRARPDKSKLTFKLVNLGWRQRYEADMLNIFSLNAEIVKMIT